MKAKKRKNKTIVLESKKEIKVGNTSFSQLFGSYIFHNKQFGKTLKSDFITTTKQSIIKDLIINEKSGIFIHAAVTPKNLQSLLKKINERVKYFRKLDKDRKKKKLPPIPGFFVHLNPEISFWVSLK